jgi:hypothetical protein
MIRMNLDLTPEEFNELWHRAIREGYFLRENPSKAWSRQEMKEAIRSWLRTKALPRISNLKE